MTASRTRDAIRPIFAVLALAAGLPGAEGEARDLMAPKEQETTEIGSTQSPSFDEQKKGIPQSLFTWIKMAKGYEVEWDTFGRKGWYTQDPRLKPVEPASVFTPDTPAIYIIFEVAPLEDPAQFAVQWFLEQEVGQLSQAPVGKDVREVAGRQLRGQALYYAARTAAVSCRESSRHDAVLDRPDPADVSARPRPLII
jgi:hypothetical protein